MVPEMEQAVKSRVQVLLFPEAEETEICHFDWHWILISNLSMASGLVFFLVWMLQIRTNPSEHRAIATTPGA